MHRLREKYFTPKAKNKDIIIREILEIVELSRSQVSLDEHKRKVNEQMQRAYESSN